MCSTKSLHTTRRLKSVKLVTMSLITKLWLSQQHYKNIKRGKGKQDTQNKINKREH